MQQQDREESYNLGVGQLFRVYFIKQHAQLYTLLFSCHHIILDGWSLPILFHHVHQAYMTGSQKTPVDVVDHAYVEAQEYLEEHAGDHVDYWMQQLSQISERGNYSGLIREPHRYKLSLRYLLSYLLFFLFYITVFLLNQ